MTTLFEASQWIDASPEIVFDYFIDPLKIVQWMGIEAQVEPGEGGTWFILFPGGVETWGRFLVYDPPHRLVFTWGSRRRSGLAGPGEPGLTTLAESTVEVSFTGRDGRTLLQLRHSGFAEGEPVAAGWVPFLATLARVATSSV